MKGWIKIAMTAAYKEWAIVCEALGSGQQSVILRKGGIAEGRGGFSFREEQFLLFPTWFHEQLEKTRLPAGTVLPPEPVDQVELRYGATVDWSGWVDDLEKLRRLEGLHVLAGNVVEERFHYEAQPGLHVALVRIFRLEPPVRLRLEKRYGGCRSWVELPEIFGNAWVSVISDEEHERRRDCFFRVIMG